MSWAGCDHFSKDVSVRVDEQTPLSIELHRDGDTWCEPAVPTANSEDTYHICDCLYMHICVLTIVNLYMLTYYIY